MRHRDVLSMAIAGVVTLGSAAVAQQPTTRPANPQAQQRQQGSGTQQQPGQAQSQRGQSQQRDHQASQGQQQFDRERIAIGVISVFDIPEYLPKGFTINEDADREGIRNVLADLTEAALSDGAYEAVVDELVDYDRDRFGAFEHDTEQLDGRVAQLREAWERKYGEAFAVDEERVFGRRYRNVQMLSGEITDPILFAASWPVRPVPQQQAQGADQPTAEPTAALVGGDPDAQIPRMNDKNLEEGRTIGIVSLPSKHNLPPLNVSLIHERLWWDWKIDVPDHVSGQELHESLLKHLTYIGENMDKLPADQDEATRIVAHHVLMALYGQPVPAYQQGQQSDS